MSNYGLIELSVAYHVFINIMSRPQGGCLWLKMCQFHCVVMILAKLVETQKKVHIFITLRRLSELTQFEYKEYQSIRFNTHLTH